MIMQKNNETSAAGATAALRFADQAAEFLSITTRCVMTAQRLRDLRSWRLWFPGPWQDRALKAADDLMVEMNEVACAAIALRTNGSPQVVHEVNLVLKAIQAVSDVGPKRVRAPDWDRAIDGFVAARNDAETVIRAELAQLKEVDRMSNSDDPTATALLAESRSLEQLATEVQRDDPVGDRLVDQLVERYHRWYGDALAWLPGDLKERFRGEYEGSILNAKIKQFLNDPLKRNPLAAGDESGLISEWMYPFDRCIRQPLNGQRQIITEASRRPRDEGVARSKDRSQDLARLIDDLANAAQAAEDELLPLAEALDKDSGRYSEAIEPFERAWSRSNLGPHALMYYEDLQTPPPRRQWSKEWGFLHQQPGWHPADHDEVIALIEQRAGLTLADLNERVRLLKDRIRHHHDELVKIAARVPHEVAHRVHFDERRSKLEELDEHTVTVRSLGESAMAGQHMSRDADSLHAGLRLAPHQTVEVAALVAFAVAERAQELVQAASRAVATAEGIRHLYLGSQASTSTAASTHTLGAGDRLTVMVSAAAITLVMLAVAVGAGFLIIEADSNIKPDDGRFALWSLIRSAAGGVGVLAVILAASAAWYGLVQRRADHVRMTLDRPLRWGAATAVAAVLLFVFGIA
jgi:hypothetical protein